jgi:hypothetical protein
MSIENAATGGCLGSAFTVFADVALTFAGATFAGRSLLGALAGDGVWLKARVENEIASTNETCDFIFAIYWLGADLKLNQHSQHCKRSSNYVFPQSA